MKFNRTTNIYLIFTVWFLVQAILIGKNGIITVGEAEKYIGEAHTLLATGRVSATFYWFYFTQILLLAFAFKTGLGYVFVVAIQLLFSAWATFSFYRLLERLFAAPAALAGTLLLLLNYPLQEFNSYLQTESLFYSFTILLSTYLLQLSRLTWLRFTIISFAVVLLCITRPTGLLFVPAIGIYLFFAFVKVISNRVKIIILASLAVAFLLVMNAVMGSKGEWDFMLPYLDERIICGVPTLYHFVDIKTDPDGDSIYGLFYYIVHNFDQFSRMALLRSKAFFGLLRTYYGLGHNVFLAAFFYPQYVAVLLSIKWWLKNNAYRFLYLSLCLSMTWGTTLLTCDDWHNRWFLSISFFLIILGLPAITKLFAIFTSYGPKRNIQ
jgi:hypothetical protein